MRDLDQREHEPQIARDGCLPRRDDDQLRVDTPAGAAQTRALIGDPLNFVSARGVDRVSYLREDDRRSLKPLHEDAL